MAEIRPFRGVVYNKEKVADLADVTAPPYDVISSAEQDAFYEKSDYNVIRLILGKKDESDNAEDNRYTRAAVFLRDWLESGALVQDERDSIYVYEQDYKMPDGSMMTRGGFIALTKIEDFSSGKILPHEKTLSGPKRDRLNLMESCHCNLSQIFSLYSDKELTVDNILKGQTSSANADMEVTDPAGITHRIFKVTDADTIAKVVNAMADKNLFIADGHHRYETALNFRDSVRDRQELPPDSLYNYVMMYFANMDDEGLVVFPTHRVMFNLSEEQISSLKSQVGDFFTVTDFPFTSESEVTARKELYARLEEAGETKHAFGMYCAGDSKYSLLVVADSAKVESIFAADMNNSLKKLDVTVLHSALINHILGVSVEAQEKQTNLKYVKDADKAIQFVNDGEFQLTFLMNPTKVEQVKEVASTGNKMPQKSTFFYPKLLTGLVINKINS